MAPSQEGSCSWNPILPLQIQCDGGIVSCSDVKDRLNPSSGQQRSARGVTNRRDPLLRARTGILKLCPFRKALRSILLLCIILKAFRRLRTRLFAANGTLFVGSFTCEIRCATSVRIECKAESTGTSWGCLVDGPWNSSASGSVSTLRSVVRYSIRKSNLIARIQDQRRWS